MYDRPVQSSVLSQSFRHASNVATLVSAGRMVLPALYGSTTEEQYIS